MSNANPTPNAQAAIPIVSGMVPVSHANKTGNARPEPPLQSAFQEAAINALPTLNVQDIHPFAQV